MKRIVFLLSILFCSVAFAHTIEWYVGDTLLSTTTCESGDNITPPTVPEKFGYHLKEWIPYKARIEYLESTGTQWIDTGVNPTGGCKIDAVIAPKLNNGVFYMQIGSIGDSNEDPNLTRNLVVIVNNEISPQKLNIPNIYCSNVSRDEPVHIYFNSIGTTFYAEINDKVCVNTTTDVLSNQTNTIKIGFSDYSRAVRQQRNYYAKIWDATNTLVRDFIPVLDINGTPCMYDKVENKYYYNAGTGQFIAGPIINE